MGGRDVRKAVLQKRGGKGVSLVRRTVAGMLKMLNKTFFKKRTVLGGRYYYDLPFANEDTEGRES